MGIMLLETRSLMEEELQRESDRFLAVVYGDARERSLMKSVKTKLNF